MGLETLQEFFVEHQRVLVIFSVLGLILTNFFTLWMYYDKKQSAEGFQTDAKSSLKIVDDLNADLRKIRSTIVKYCGKLSHGESTVDRVERFAKEKDKIHQDYVNERGTSDALRKKVEELENELSDRDDTIKNQMKINEQLEQAIEDAKSRLSDIAKQDQPDYEGQINTLTKSNENLEKQVRRLTSSRDDVRNERDRLQVYADNVESMMLKSKKTYQAKLAKLRSAIREENGYYLELEGRKIKVLREEE